MTIQLKTICQLYRAIVQGKLQYKLYLVGDKMRIWNEREILTKFCLVIDHKKISVKF